MDKKDRDAVIGAVYRHFKGGLYTVLLEAVHSESLESVVVYRSHEAGTVWARPKYGPNGFLSTTFDEDGERERFVRVGLSQGVSATEEGHDIGVANATCKNCGKTFTQIVTGDGNPCAGKEQP